MNSKSTVALVAVVAISAILVASILADDANARRCRNSGGSVHQTSAQACVQGGANGQCQNLNSQNAGHDIASNTIGLQTRS